MSRPMSSANNSSNRDYQNRRGMHHSHRVQHQQSQSGSHNRHHQNSQPQRGNQRVENRSRSPTRSQQPVALGVSSLSSNDHHQQPFQHIANLPSHHHQHNHHNQQQTQQQQSVSMPDLSDAEMLINASQNLPELLSGIEHLEGNKLINFLSSRGKRGHWFHEETFFFQNCKKVKLEPVKLDKTIAISRLMSSLVCDKAPNSMIMCAMVLGKNIKAIVGFKNPTVIGQNSTSSNGKNVPCDLCDIPLEVVKPDTFESNLNVQDSLNYSIVVHYKTVYQSTSANFFVSIHLKYWLYILPYIQSNSLINDFFEKQSLGLFDLLPLLDSKHNLSINLPVQRCFALLLNRFIDAANIADIYGPHYNLLNSLNVYSFFTNQSVHKCSWFLYNLGLSHCFHRVSITAQKNLIIKYFFYQCPLIIEVLPFVPHSIDIVINSMNLTIRECLYIGKIAKNCAIKLMIHHNEILPVIMSHILWAKKYFQDDCPYMAYVYATAALLTFVEYRHLDEKRKISFDLTDIYQNIDQNDVKYLYNILYSEILHLMLKIVSTFQETDYQVQTFMRGICTLANKFPFMYNTISTLMFCNIQYGMFKFNKDLLLFGLDPCKKSLYRMNTLSVYALGMITELENIILYNLWMIQECVTFSGQYFNFEDQVLKPLQLLKEIEHLLSFYQLDMHVCDYNYYMVRYYVLEFCLNYQISGSCKQLTLHKLCSLSFTASFNSSEFLTRLKLYEVNATVSLMKGHLHKALHSLGGNMITNVEIHLSSYLSLFDTNEIDVTGIQEKYENMLNRIDTPDVSSICIQLFLTQCYFYPATKFPAKSIELLHEAFSCIDKITLGSSYRIKLLEHLYNSITLNKCTENRPYTQKCHQHVLTQGTDLFLSTFNKFYSGLEIMKDLFSHQLNYSASLPNFTIKSNYITEQHDNDTKSFLKMIKNFHINQLRSYMIKGLKQINYES